MATRSFKPYKLISAATTNATSVKAVGARLYGYEIGNTSAAIKFVKLYNKATAPTVGTDVPVMTIEVPASSRAALTLPMSALFPAGLGLAITGVLADADATAVALGDVVVNLFFE